MTPARYLTRRAFTSLCALAAALFISSCGYPTHIDPPLLTYPTEALTRFLAEAHAQQIGGMVFVMLDTHSMEPLIKGGDYVVIASPKRRPYSGVRAGEVGAYKAAWYPKHPVVHRFTTKDGGGWIMSGDGNRYSEPQWRVTEATYLGTVEAIYRVKP